jgi:hypothetical protein
MRVRFPLARFTLAGVVLGLWLGLVPACFSSGATPPASPIYSFDARPLNRGDWRAPTNAARTWDTLHLLAALQGLANRVQPRLYLFYCSEFGVDTDQFWFNWLRGEGGWLREAEVRPLESLEETVRVFRHAFQGLVVYDPAVPVTSNLASTAAGCEDLLPVRYDPSPGSVYDHLVQQMQLPVRLWLVHPDGSPLFTGKGTIPETDLPTSGSAKGDAYRWAIARYLKVKRCDPGVAAYYVDAFWLSRPGRSGPTMHTLSNHDYFIAHRAFFFDLSPWGDETPNDDRTQPLGLDRALFLEVLRALSDRASGSLIRVGGFTPWPFKYTRSADPALRHDGVPTEWEFARLISQFNGYMEADAAGLSAMANASFFQHYPLAARYPQPNPPPSLDIAIKNGYVTSDGKVADRFFVGHYVGDYDSPAWLYKAIPAFFPDPARGQVPLGWAFDPNLADRAPQALVYAYRMATTNDFFIAGDSGAGYLNPRGLTRRPDSGLPAGLELWTEHCRRYYERWDLRITGFILEGASGSTTDREFRAYQSFSPHGAGTHFEKSPALHFGMPTCPERDLPDNVTKAAALIADAARQRGNGPGFLWARSILKPPRWYADLSKHLAEDYPDARIVVVDPYTFFSLIRKHF